MGLCSSPNLPNNITLRTVNIAGLNSDYSHNRGWGGGDGGWGGCWSSGGLGWGARWVGVVFGGECHLHVGINKIGERKDI